MINPDDANDFKLIGSAVPDEEGLITCPVVPLPDLVIYPNVVSPLSVFTVHSKAAIHAASSSQHTVIGVAQRDPRVSEPEAHDLYMTGTELALGQKLPLSDDGQMILAQGRRRVEIVEFVVAEPYLVARARPVTETSDDPHKIQTIVQTVVDLLKHMAEYNEDIPEEVIEYATSLDEPGRLADLIASTVIFPLEERQHVLELSDVTERLKYVANLLAQELQLLEIKNDIHSQIQNEMTRIQREMYLREQMRIIQSELGEEDIFQQEIDEIQDKIAEVQLPGDVDKKARKELARLALMPPIAPEINIVRTYLDWLLALPWHTDSQDNLDLARAQEVLDTDHYGLPRVKERILEHMAVRKLAADQMKSPILCFLGPPGVGKTSMGKSIARALGRAFVRVSLGGVRDEAEIRGHRRTYIGALPGRIIQTMRNAGTINPVFMLDEIDKLGTDFRGDPASALLEVLDPEQNRAFSDHYLDVAYDLSKVLFITTANELYPLPPALEDRLEVIEFPGYTEEEKLEIARRFLIPKQLAAHGLKGIGLQFQTGALHLIIREYTYEAGVRNLERELARVCRKIARLVAEEKRFPKRINARSLNNFLGPAHFTTSRANDIDSVGVVTGLVWTAGGGDIQTIEVAIVPGKGSLTLTGQLGDVLQESAQAALSYLRALAAEFNVPDEDFENYDVHIHMPEGAIPKDGPSAGIALAAAIVSAFTGRKIRCDYAMTGEITLRGKILPVGGIKEKVLTARRNRLKHIILPAQNEKDLVEIPRKALRDLDICFVENMEQVLAAVLLDEPLEGRHRDKQQPDQPNGQDRTTDDIETVAKR